MQHSIKFLLLLMLISSVVALPAQYRINGVITDSNDGSALPGVTVRIKGTSYFTMTDVNGKFQLRSERPAVTVQFSMVGYEMQEYKCRPALFKDSVAFIRLQLKAVSGSLEEVVVVGYSGERDEVSSAAPDARLEGRVAGVSITTGRHMKLPAPAADGSIRIRGAASITTPATAGIDDVMGRRSTAADSIIQQHYAKMLTAGEVNDFKKWTLWSDYTTDVFKTYSEQWSLYAKKRYALQLVNKEGFAVTGEPVLLIDAVSGDTVWAAVSDNTGKAELWESFTGKAHSSNLVIKTNTDKKSYTAIPFTQGMNRIVLDKSCAVSDRVQVAFVVDATGSMQDEINYLKEELQDVMQNVVAKDPSVKLQTGAVFYRDHSDVYLTRVQPFADGIDACINFIRKQEANGGGDFPEAVDAALEAALNQLNWSADARARIVFLLLDAPPHDDAREQIQEQVELAAAKGIRIIPVACSGTDKATEFILRSMALATNGTYLFLTDDSGIGNSHIKPTTDEFKVELLNDLLQRVLLQMIYVNNCTTEPAAKVPVMPFNQPVQVTVFPNPTSGAVRLQTTAKLKEIFIADFTGKILQRIRTKAKTESYELDLSMYPSGTYLVRYLTEDGHSGAEKIIVQH